MNEHINNTLNDQINEVWDIAVYLQLMGAFVPYSDFQKVKEVTSAVHDFFKTSDEEEIIDRLPELRLTLGKMAELFIEKFPLKKDINTIATNWNNLFKTQQDPFGKGINYGWLEEQMDLKNLGIYDYAPYHLKIGLVANKGHCGIEEEFLLTDSFNAFNKAEYYFDLLITFGERLKKSEEYIGQIQLKKGDYTRVTYIKYEAAAFSRLTIISFYAFIESFVNSIGYDYLQRNDSTLNLTEKELLKGFKKGNYLSLKSKIEIFQKIIRKDKKAIFILSDDKQIKEPFLSFFDYYEELRNASVHFSPGKEQIWLSIDDWLEKARTFSKLAMEVGLIFWKTCIENSDGPQYLGKLNYELHYDNAKKRMKEIHDIEATINRGQ